jgi:hypothetical protein
MSVVITAINKVTTNTELNRVALQLRERRVWIQNLGLEMEYSE